MPGAGMIHDFMRMLKRHLRPSETETQAERRTVGTIRNAEWLPTNLPRLNILDAKVEKAEKV